MEVDGEPAPAADTAASPAAAPGCDTGDLPSDTATPWLRRQPRPWPPAAAAGGGDGAAASSPVSTGIAPAAAPAAAAAGGGGGEGGLPTADQLSAAVAEYLSGERGCPVGPRQVRFQRQEGHTRGTTACVCGGGGGRGKGQVALRGSRCCVLRATQGGNAEHRTLWRSRPAMQAATSNKSTY
jgi:hypothetical protein